ncbi:MAG: aminotransferase, partial [Oscillospiraceae bacterium]
MKLDEFVLENWLNPAANSPKNKVYLGGSCVLPMTVEELFELTGENLDSFLEDLKKMNLGYGFFAGTPRLREAVAKLYKGVTAEDVILVHGGTGANNTV